VKPVRPTLAYVSLDNIAHNIASFRGLLPQDTELMAVVKADAYGHGAVDVARSALSAGANRLAVAIVDEAVELRRSQIGAPILILGHTAPDMADLVARFGLSAAIMEPGFARALSDAGVRNNRRVKVHLKVDTGMNRLGVRPEEAAGFAEFVSSLPALELEGVFTHFASADAPDLSEARRQLSRFLKSCTALENRGFRLIRHAANTAAVITLPESHLDMVRLGIGIYGLHPAGHLRGQPDLRPALSLRSHISMVKWIDPGESVGYGGTFMAQSARRIATVPIGYADGYSRKMSNRGRAIINGKTVPVVGTICMDQLMLDVTEIDCSQYDEIILLGRSGNNSISADDLADAMGTINYEVTSSIGPRVPRIYTRKNREVSGRSLLGRWD
jgi:alanine racemase